MMKKVFICGWILFASVQFVSAQVKLDSVVVDAKSLRDERALSNQAVSYNHFTSKELQSQRVFSVKGLTGSVPNLYVPDYGSKLTSSIYIRGIGSRINSSAVGVYVDDFPYYDKSAFDFDFSIYFNIKSHCNPNIKLLVLFSIFKLFAKFCACDTVT